VPIRIKLRIWNTESRKVTESRNFRALVLYDKYRASMLSVFPCSRAPRVRRLLASFAVAS